MTFVAGTVLTAAALNSELAAKTDLAMAKNAQTGSSYSYALADASKLLTMSNASANTVLVTKQATVTWAADTQLRVLNIGAGATTLVADTGVTINNNTALAQWRGGVLIRMSSDVWTFIPFASGVGAAVYSDANTGTYTGYAYKTFTASGTLTVTTAGFADILVCGGGGGSGNSGGGGAGGVLQVTSAYLPVGTLTVTVGAGGARATTGNTSIIGGTYFGVGGGSCSLGDKAGFGGGSGGGGGDQGLAGGAGVTGQGNAGGTSAPADAGSGGGGAGAVGANASGSGVGSVGGNGGAGTTITLAGTTPTGAYVAGSYALGGGGGGGGPGTGGTGGSGGGGNGAAGIDTATGTAGAANKGGGGGATYASTTKGTAGGSGIVIVRVAV